MIPATYCKLDTSLTGKSKEGVIVQSHDLPSLTSTSYNNTMQGTTLVCLYGGSRQPMPSCCPEERLMYYIEARVGTRELCGLCNVTGWSYVNSCSLTASLLCGSLSK
jgi:hypothetical protein